MSKQTLYVGSYALAVVALFYLNASVYAFLIAAALVLIAFFEPIIAFALRLFVPSEADDW